MYQALWSRPDASGGHHYLDVHWRLNNAQVLAQVLAWPELAARSTPLPALGASARALAPVDALLLACIHRAGHAGETAQIGDIVRQGSDRLIWLYDIHLLIGGMSAAELDAFVELAAARQVRAICLNALQRCSASAPRCHPRARGPEPTGAGGALGRPAPGGQGAQAGGRLPGDPGMAQPAALAPELNQPAPPDLAGSIPAWHLAGCRSSTCAGRVLPSRGSGCRNATAAEAFGEGAGNRVNLLIIKSNNLES